MSYPIRKVEIEYEIYSKLFRTLGEPPLMPVQRAVNVPGPDLDTRWGILLFQHKLTGPEGILLVPAGKVEVKPNATA